MIAWTPCPYYPEDFVATSEGIGYSVRHYPYGIDPGGPDTWAAQATRRAEGRDLGEYSTSNEAKAACQDAGLVIESYTVTEYRLASR